MKRCVDAGMMGWSKGERYVLSSERKLVGGMRPDCTGQGGERLVRREEGWRRGERWFRDRETAPSQVRGAVVGGDLAMGLVQLALSVSRFVRSCQSGQMSVQVALQTQWLV